MIIVIANSKGGVGKTILATNLYYYLREFSPTIVNLDIQNSIIDLNNIRKNKAKSFEIIQATNINSLEEVYNKNAKDKLFLLDTIGTDTELTRTALLIADVIISPTSDKTIDILGLMNFSATLNNLSQKSNTIIKAQVVINNVLPSIKKLDDMRNFIASSSHFSLLNSIIRQRVDISNSIGYGLAVGEYNPNSKAHAEFLQLANEIKNLLAL